MKQMEANRKDYIAKLKNELLTVESRFHQRVDQTEMVAQDYMSRAFKNFEELNRMKGHYEQTQADLDATRADRDVKAAKLVNALEALKFNEMRGEDLESRICFVINA